MNSLQVETPFNISLNFSVAAVHTRFFAWLIDFFSIFLLYRGGVLLIVNFFGVDSWDTVFQLAVLSPLLSYHLIWEISTQGRSLGKMVMGLQVLSADGRKASNYQYFLRWLMRMLDFGILWAIVFIDGGTNFFSILFVLTGITAFIVFLTQKHHQRLGDLGADTVVVYKKLPYDIDDTIFRIVDQNYEVQFPAVMKLSDNDMNVIDNVLKRNAKTPIPGYLESVVLKIKSALEIESDLANETFLEVLLNDYNFIAKK